MANQYTNKESAQYARLEARQAAALEVLRHNPSYSMEAIERDLGYSKGTIRQWYHRDSAGFKQKWHDALRDTFSRLEGLAIQCMADLIVDGNFQAAKYVLDNKGYAAPKEIKADVNVAAQVVFIDDLTEEDEEEVCQESD